MPDEETTEIPAKHGDCQHQSTSLSINQPLFAPPLFKFCMLSRIRCLKTPAQANSYTEPDLHLFVQQRRFVMTCL